MRNRDEFFADAIAVLSAACARAAAMKDPELALKEIATAACEGLGDKQAHLAEGALKPGEKQVSISGYFFVRRRREDMILIAEVGWPPDQHRLVIGVDEGRPGWVVRNAQPLVLPNTDEDRTFTQIISSARMGSSLYAPLRWQGETLGLITVASQARRTYGEIDLALLGLVANHVAALWVALGGPDTLSKLREGTRIAPDRED